MRKTNARSAMRTLFMVFTDGFSSTPYGKLGTASASYFHNLHFPFLIGTPGSSVLYCVYRAGQVVVDAG